MLPPGSALDFVAAGTNWSGLSTPRGAAAARQPARATSATIFSDPVLVAQVFDLIDSFIGQIFIDFDQFQALPDRLRQGQLHTLVLARMIHEGVFNQHPCFQAPRSRAGRLHGGGDGDPSRGVLAGGEQTYYFGASLGGIMGLMFAALSPDVERVVANVPAINFSFLLRSLLRVRAVRRLARLHRARSARTAARVPGPPRDLGAR